ncbi:hypothetical protein DBV14_16105 [Variovorax sp. KBW07]|nr:hypothetical protein DBV14_16105 [Variovorax sp. KBW07]
MLARVAIERLPAYEPRVMQRRGISVEEAMKARDVQLQEALDAVRCAADDASAAVGALLHMVKPNVRLQTALQVVEEQPRKMGFVTLAQELREVAFQLRILEASVKGVSGLSRAGVV